MTFMNSPGVRRGLSHLAGAMVPIAIAASMAQAQARPAKPAAAKAIADSSMINPPVRQSWTSDKMRFGIGDIVTIIIRESTAASANLTDNNSETRKKTLGLDIEPPASPTGISTNVKMTMGFNNNGTSRKSGDAVRQNDFHTLMSARVIGVSPTGMLQIRGHKIVNVDKNQQDVTVKGWIRPQDITIGVNTIESSRIADAEIDYGQKGALGKPRSGLLSKILGALWP